MKTGSLSTFRGIVVLAVLFSLALFTEPIQADDSPYFQPKQVDFAALLAPPPLPGSAEEAADLATVRSVHKAATPADLAAAKSEEDFDVLFSERVTAWGRSR